jgi:hypothetical protein
MKAFGLGATVLESSKRPCWLGLSTSKVTLVLSRMIDKTSDPRRKKRHGLVEDSKTVAPEN